MNQSERSVNDLDVKITSPEILIVDDESEVTELNRHRIEDEGYRGVTAYGGEEAIEKLSTNIDVVLLDRRMPKMSGDKVLEKIHELGYNVQVVMVTAVDPSMDISGMEFDDYVSKPIGRQTLVDVTEKQLKIKELNKTTRKIASLKSKIEILEDKNARSELKTKEEYKQLKSDLKEATRHKETLEQKV